MLDKYFFLNVGCADCTIMHLDDKIVMIDCHQGNSDECEDNILDYIPHKKIDLLIITHQHYDHFDGIQTLLDNDIEVNEIWESCYERRRGDTSVKYDEWNEYQKLIKELDAKIYQPTRSNKSFDSIGGANFKFYNPPTNINNEETRELHDACLVFSVFKKGKSVMFTGDASDSALQSIHKHYILKEKFILHASHHGSLKGANLDFIKAISPSYTIISTKSEVYENVPHATALRRYATYTKEEVKRTDQEGLITYSH